MRLKLTIQYDGTEYSGWQFQPGSPTIQGVLEAAFTRIEGRRIPVHGAGRTDAGVHALGQVAHVDVDKRHDPDVWIRALNSKLPLDVRVMRVEPVAERFHARILATNKLYRYRVWTGPSVSPFAYRYVAHKPYEYDLGRMREAAAALVGCRDFSAFTITDRETKTTTRDVRRLDVDRGGEDGEEIVISAEAKGFLRVMVRTLAGTLLGVGDGSISFDRITKALETGAREFAGPTAPAAGLTLVRVDY